MKSTKMQPCEIKKALLPKLLSPAKTGTAPTSSGTQLMKTAIPTIGRNIWFISKHPSIPLDTSGFT